MRFSLFLFCCFIGLAPNALKAEKTVSLVVKGPQCDAMDSMFLFSFNGFRFAKEQVGKKKNNEFHFSLPISGPKFYYIGRSNQDMRPLLLGDEPQVTVSGSCGFVRQAIIQDSRLNTLYDSLKVQFQGLQNQHSGLIREFQAKQYDQNQRTEVLQKMKVLDDQKIALYAFAKSQHPFLGKVLAFNTYLSFHNNQGEYPDEINYYVNEYFKFVDWTDTEHNYNAWVYEASKAYAETLGSVGIDQNQLIDIFNQIVLSKIPNPSRTLQLAYGGMLNGLQSKNSPALGPFAKQIMPFIEANDPASLPSLAAIVKQSSTFIMGAEAPELAYPTPNGDIVKLSDYRGKVVLIDFWASWCGPCRRENPNVVRIYNEYKAKGFDILGVSLDQNKESWVAAIEKDGLTWKHISDLKGWQSEAAAIYSVRSIPHTVLVDKDGNILARNLRGDELERKLKELFPN